MKTSSRHQGGAHIFGCVFCGRLRRLATVGNLALALCIPVSALAQDEVAPLEEFDLDPAQAPTSTAESDARFTSSLLRDAERYATGKDYEYNPTRAYQLYKKAAETGNPRAVYEVAKCLILGEGVKLDEKKGQSVLEGLAGIIVQAKDFHHVRGFNPILMKSFKSVKNLTPAAIVLSDFKARDGSVILDPSILSINESSLRMMHSTGISTIAWDQLPAYVQEAIGYDKTSALFEEAIVVALKAGKT